MKMLRETWGKTILGWIIAAFIATILTLAITEGGIWLLEEQYKS